jgi:hypothetical protein
VKKARWYYLGFVLGLSASACILQPDEDDDAGGGTDADAGTETMPASAGTQSSVDPSSADGSSESGSAEGTSSGGEVDATQRCDALCELWLAADCNDNWTMAGCMLTCESLTSAGACNASANTYIDCAESSTIACDANDATYAVGCGLEWLDAIGCAVTEDPNPDLVDPCAEYCGNVQEAACPANGTENDCNVACLWSGNPGVGCDPQWLTFLDCANAAEWSCLIGFAVAEGCGDELTDYGVCVGEAGSS